MTTGKKVTNLKLSQKEMQFFHLLIVTKSCKVPAVLSRMLDISQMLLETIP